MRLISYDPITQKETKYTITSKYAVQYVTDHDRVISHDHCATLITPIDDLVNDYSLFYLFSSTSGGGFIGSMSLSETINAYRGVYRVPDVKLVFHSGEYLSEALRSVKCPFKLRRVIQQPYNIMVYCLLFDNAVDMLIAKAYIQNGFAVE